MTQANAHLERMTTKEGSNMSVTSKESFNISLPKGYSVLTESFAVQGANRRIESINRALKVKDFESNIFIEPEPDNDHDKNALMVVIKKKTLFSFRYFHIGYVPKELAEIICKYNLQYKIKIRILKRFTYENGNTAIIADFIGLHRFIGHKLGCELDNWSA